MFGALSVCPQREVMYGLSSKILKALLKVKA
jgi:hypothetical protein